MPGKQLNDDWQKTLNDPPQLPFLTANGVNVCPENVGMLEYDTRGYAGAYDSDEYGRGGIQVRW